MPTPYDTDLERNAANFQPLTPLSFLARAAEVYPDQTAIIHGKRSWSYRQFFSRAKQFASALANREFSKVVKDALALCKARPLVVDYDDPEFAGPGDRLGFFEYEDFLREG